jgi:adenylate cyclase
LVRVIASNAGDKLLGDEDLALFQLVDDIARNDQVIYALIVDKKNTIKAHSRIDAVNKPFFSPNSIRDVKRENDVITRMIIHAGAEALFFEKPIIYQKLKVGTVYLSISQVKVLQNIRKAKGFLWMLTGLITVLGILLSLVLSTYFSRPIRNLSKGAKALGLGNFNSRVSIERNDEFGDLAIAFNRMAEDLKLTEIIKNSFGRYVTPEIVERIIANPDDQWMKGSKVDVSVLFVDIRGFAGLSENKDPERIVEMLNDYFTCVYDAVIDYGGNINKFVGDEAMVIFGAPASNPRHAEDAVRAALAIQKEILKLNRVKRAGIENIQVGVGINSGEMVAGNLGSQMRMEYTVIGDNVNIASRLTSLAKAGEILISSSTYDLIIDTGDFQVNDRGRVSVKGRERKVGTFNIIALNEDQDHDGTQNKEY